MNFKIERLLDGETITTKAFGHSMKPHIESGQKHDLEPILWDDCKKGDIVYCKVRGKLVTHFVKVKDNNKGLLIANARGVENGWTKTVYGRVIKIHE